MVVGLVIKTVYQFAQAVTLTEKFAFQQPPKYRQRRCTLRRWRQTVPHARTGDTKCTVAYGSPSRPRDVQSGRGRGLQPSAWLQGCHWLQLTYKVWRSSTMETTENKHRKFELNVLMYRQPVQFPEQWRYVLFMCLRYVYLCCQCTTNHLHSHNHLAPI